jgi:hypothetical protein
MQSRAEWCLKLAGVTVVTVACVYLSGCVKTVQIYGPTAPPEFSKGNDVSNKQKGIPFYNHMGICTQEKTWNEPQTTLTLSVTPEGGSTQTQMMVLANEPFYKHEADVFNLLTALEVAQGKHEITAKDKNYCPANVADGWNKVRQAYEVKPINETEEPSNDAQKLAISNAVAAGDLLLISNTASVGTAVDYSHVYYINTNQPWMGTATVDAKIGADGTLTDGSVTVDNETAADLLTAASTVASSGLTALSTIAAAKLAANGAVAAAIAAAAAPAGGGQMSTMAFIKKPHTDGTPGGCAAGEGFNAFTAKSITYKFEVGVSGYKHVHKVIEPLAGTSYSCEAAPDDLLKGSYSVTPLSDSGKPDKNAIGVSGTITLPKPDDKK